MHIIEPEIKNTNHTNPIIEALVALIDEHYSEQNLMTYAAKELNYTIPYLSAVFKNHFGISFKEFISISQRRCEIFVYLINSFFSESHRLSFYGWRR
jgi:YesN/AraC family two-component response regulator